MKRILLACFMLTATVGVTSLQHASAYVAPAAPVTASAFGAKVKLMDSQIGAGNITAANATWEEIHEMMKSVLAVTKSSISAATTPTETASFNTIMQNQITIYQAAWNLKPNLATNRVAIKAKLDEFKATIY